MLAVRLEQYGRMPVVAEVPEPELQGDDDVVVRVEGAGVCRTDLHAFHGERAMTHAHYLALVGARGNFQYVGQGLRLRDERMIAPHLARLR